MVLAMFAVKSILMVVELQAKRWPVMALLCTLTSAVELPRLPQTSASGLTVAASQLQDKQPVMIALDLAGSTMVNTALPTVNLPIQEFSAAKNNHISI